MAACSRRLGAPCVPDTAGVSRRNKQISTYSPCNVSYRSFVSVLPRFKLFHSNAKKLDDARLVIAVSPQS